jgi:serine/threonine-protein kinase
MAGLYDGKMPKEYLKLVSPGQVVGHYKVLSSLGRGGMGEVFLAEDISLGRTVAIKLLAPEAFDSKNLARFVQEARVMVRLSGEHVTRVFDIGTLESGLPYIVMEHLRGHDLGYLIEKQGPLSVEEATTSILQALEALAEAHAMGIVHRDLKPSNLFLTPRQDGRWFVKVLDFGVSKIPQEEGGECITATADVFGTPAYMSPEQTKSAKLADARSDIWSLGLILAECLSGRPVYEGSTQLAILTAIVSGPLPSLHLEGKGVPPELESVIRRCLHKNPADRYPNVSELAAALRPFAPKKPLHVRGLVGRIVGGEADSSDAVTLLEATRRLRAVVRPRRALWIAAAALPIALGVSLLARSARTDTTSPTTVVQTNVATHASDPPLSAAPDVDVSPQVEESSDTPHKAPQAGHKPARDARATRATTRLTGLEDRK